MQTEVDSANIKFVKYNSEVKEIGELTTPIHTTFPLPKIETIASLGWQNISRIRK
jgi:hypothetical protein